MNELIDALIDDLLSQAEKVGIEKTVELEALLRMPYKQRWKIVKNRVSVLFVEKLQNKLSEVENMK